MSSLDEFFDKAKADLDKRVETFDKQMTFDILSDFVLAAKRRSMKYVANGQGIRDSFERACDDILEEMRPRPPKPKVKKTKPKAVVPKDPAPSAKPLDESESPSRSPSPPSPPISESSK